METVDIAASAGVGYVCVTSASGAMKSREREQALRLEQLVSATLSHLPPNRFVLGHGEEWSVSLSALPCSSATLRDAGAD